MRWMATLNLRSLAAKKKIMKVRIRSIFWSLWLEKRRGFWKQHICCKSFWQSGPKAKGQRWDWCWTDACQSNIDRHCSGFVSPTEKGGMHGTAFDVSFSLQVISIHLLLNLLDMRSDQPFCQDAGSMSWLRCKAVCFGCCRKFYCSFCLAVGICKPFVLGCLGCVVLQ